MKSDDDDDDDQSLVMPELLRGVLVVHAPEVSYPLYIEQSEKKNKEESSEGTINLKRYNVATAHYEGVKKKAGVSTYM